MWQLFEKGLIVYHDWKTRRKLERVFQRGEDPYGYWSHPHEREKQNIIESLVNGVHHESALEIGCAEGAFTKRLARFCRHVLAIDLSPTAIQRAQNKLRHQSNISLVCSNIRHCQFAAHWDLIVMSEVLYYVTGGSALRNEFQKLVNRITKGLKVGGKMILVHGFSGETELETRRGYSRRFLENPDMRLVKEFVAGTDPKKSKYLVSLLEKTDTPDLQRSSIGLRTTLCALQVLGSLSLVGCRGVWSPNIVRPTEIKNFQEAKVKNSRSEKHENYLRQNLSPHSMSDKKRAEVEERLKKLRERKK